MSAYQKMLNMLFLVIKNYLEFNMDLKLSKRNLLEIFRKKKL